MMVAPKGIAEIVKVYGDPFASVNDKTAWEIQTLAIRPLPVPVPYAYGPGLITRTRAHHLIVDQLVDVFAACIAKGVPPARMHYGGCYCWRAKKTRGSELSTHTWGIAIDLEPVLNPLRRVWRDDGLMLDPRIIACFLARGWTWGGAFTTPDPMHFQFAAGY